MTTAEIMALVSRVRREMPRNKLVMQLCDQCERLVVAPPRAPVRKPPLSRAEIQRNYRLRKKAAKG